MRKHIPLVLVAALALACAAWAGDPWKDKTYDSWDEKDLQKILNDSPWSRSCSLGMLQGISGRETTVDSSTSAGGSTMQEGSGGGGGRRRGGGSTPDIPSTPQVVFVARWYSARTILRAETRYAQLRGTNQPVPDPPAAYRLVVSSHDPKGAAELREFGAMDPDALAQHTWLDLKKTHQKIVPSSVHMVKSQDGKYFIALVADFPRKAANGEPSIPAAERDIEFVTGTGKTTLKFHYDLEKMVDKEGVDL